MNWCVTEKLVGWVKQRGTQQIHALGYTSCVGLHLMRWVTPHALGYTSCVGLHFMRWVTPHALGYTSLHPTYSLNHRSIEPYIIFCPKA
jgi:hypothetical protein